MDPDAFRAGSGTPPPRRVHVRLNRPHRRRPRLPAPLLAELARVTGETEQHVLQHLGLLPEPA